MSRLKEKIAGGKQLSMTLYYALVPTSPRQNARKVAFCSLSPLFSNFPQGRRSKREKIKKKRKIRRNTGQKNFYAKRYLSLHKTALSLLQRHDAAYHSAHSRFGKRSWRSRMPQAE